MFPTCIISYQLFFLNNVESSFITQTTGRGDFMHLGINFIFICLCSLLFDIPGHRLSSRGTGIEPVSLVYQLELVSLSATVQIRFISSFEIPSSYQSTWYS